jgi:isoamylase
VLSRVKLIAEPWDVGDGGYRVGGFPRGWSEWNDKVRDPVRAFWRSDPGQVPAVAHGLAGSAEVYKPSGRHPWATINYIASHDGYTLHDLVSYNERHNEANGEDNRDGHSHNLSWNCGVEGPTDDPEVLELRARQKRNMLATIFLSQGVPMLLMGDELSRSQGGNNNAYAQDNETNWMDWEAGRAADPDLPEFVRALNGIRRRFDAFKRHDYFDGMADHPHGLEDVYWLAPEGREMSAEDWNDGNRRAFGMQFGNDAKDGQRFLILMNGSPDPADFRLPDDFPGHIWVSVLETGLPRGVVRDEPATLEAGQTITLDPRTLVLFQHAVRAEEGI